MPNKFNWFEIIYEINDALSGELKRRSVTVTEAHVPGVSMDLRKHGAKIIGDPMAVVV